MIQFDGHIFQMGWSVQPPTRNLWWWFSKGILGQTGNSGLWAFKIPDWGVWIPPKGLCSRYGGFLKWWVSPTTMGFPTKNDQFGFFGGTTIWGNTHILAIYRWVTRCYAPGTEIDPSWSLQDRILPLHWRRVLLNHDSGRKGTVLYMSFTH